MVIGRPSYHVTDCCTLHEGGGQRAKDETGSPTPSATLTVL